MAKISKRQKALAGKIDAAKVYSLDEAVTLLKDVATAKFTESVDMSVNLGIDARKSDQNVRGSTVLPHGNGKTVRVAVFTQGAKAEEARAAGADEVGMEDLAQKMKDGTRKEVRWAEDGGKKYEGMEVDANDEDEDMLKELAGGKSGSVVFRRQMS